MARVSPFECPKSFKWKITLFLFHCTAVLPLGKAASSKLVSCNEHFSQSRKIQRKLGKKKKKTINVKACLQVCSPRLSLISRTLQHTQSPVNTCKGAAKHDSCPHGKSSLPAFSSETQLCSAILQIVRRFGGEAPLQDCLCNGPVIRLEIYQAVIGSRWGRETGEEG